MQTRVDPASAPETALLEAAVHRAFDFWIRHDFTCPNWWYNQIGAPKLLGLLAVLMGAALTAEEHGYITRTVLPRAKIGMTGQNRVWLAGNTLMLALLTDDAALVGEAARTIWSEIIVTEGEGIQPDFSFHQHGAQQQFGNYGMGFAVEICRWGVILRDTDWAMPDREQAVFRGYMLEGQNWVTWGGRMDISSLGRQFMPHSPTIKAVTIARVMENTALFDEARAADYRAFAGRNQLGAANDLVGCRAFWRSDYVVHRRPEFCATLKMCSRRVVGAESLNGENLQGYHIADGALYLYRAGDDYDGVFSVWDWSRLPGVTCQRREDGVPSFHEYRVDRDFVGAVTDGVRGAAAFDYARDGVEVRKAWFFGEKGIVCLGAGLVSTGDGVIATTLNQCRLRGPVTVSQAGVVRVLAQGTHALDGADWVEHDGWHYQFLQASPVRLEIGPRRGEWHRVFNNPETPVGEVETELFILWLDHGVRPAGAAAGYAYAVMPIPMPTVGEAAEFSVLVNTSSAQAVSIEGREMVVAWESGAIATGEGGGSFGCEVDAACLLILERGAKARWTVADPLRQVSAIAVSAAGETRTIVLPAGAQAGSSVTSAG